MNEAPRRIPNLLHFLLFLGLTITLVILVEMVAVFVLREPALHSLVNQKVQLIVSGVAYLATLAAASLLFPAMWGAPFWTGIRWNAMGAKPLLALFGLVLGFLAEFIGSYLPTPRKMPIDDVFGTPGILWFMVVFGTTLAPLFEEIVFRGLLLPALANAFDWLCLPHAEDREAAHAEWRQSDRLSAPSLVFSSLLTSVLFALIHAPQLGFNWAPVALLLCVSLVLCFVRIRFRSVAASTLVHGFYNLAAFVLIFISTSGFRHMDAP